MIRIWSRPKYPDRWEDAVDVDPRFGGLLALSNAIVDVLEPDWAEEDGRPLDRPAPLELAQRLRVAANRIEEMTQTD